MVMLLDQVEGGTGTPQRSDGVLSRTTLPEWVCFWRARGNRAADELLGGMRRGKKKLKNWNRGRNWKRGRLLHLECRNRQERQSRARPLAQTVSSVGRARGTLRDGAQSETAPVSDLAVPRLALSPSANQQGGTRQPTGGVLIVRDWESRLAWHPRLALRQIRWIAGRGGRACKGCSLLITAAEP